MVQEEDMMYISRKNLVILVAVVSIGLVYVLSVGLSRVGKIPVQINTLPPSSQITIDGNKSSTGLHYLNPGKHTITATMTGYSPSSQTIDITRGSDRVIVDLLPIPVSSDALAWVKQNGALYGKFEERGGEQAQRTGAEERRKNPILNELPYTDNSYDFQIGYRDNGDDIILTIYADSSVERQAALGVIQQWGYDPADYEIDFVGYKNPLGGQ